MASALVLAELDEDAAKSLVRVDEVWIDREHALEQRASFSRSSALELDVGKVGPRREVRRIDRDRGAKRLFGVTGAG